MKPLPPPSQRCFTMWCFNFLVLFCRNHPQTPSRTYWLLLLPGQNKRPVFWEASSALQENAAILTHRLSLFSGLLHHEVPGAHLSPLGRSIPSGTASTLACPPVLQGLASTLSVKNICIHSPYSLSMKTLASAPEVIARFIQIPRERRTGYWEHSDTAISSWPNGTFIPLLGCLQMLTIKPGINEREMIAISEIPW